MAYKSTDLPPSCYMSNPNGEEAWAADRSVGRLDEWHSNTEKPIKGGIVEFIPAKICLNSSHNPPENMVYKPGHHKYQCPGCGHTTEFDVPLIIC